MIRTDYRLQSYIRTKLDIPKLPATKPEVKNSERIIRKVLKTQWQLKSGLLQECKKAEEDLKSYSCLIHADNYDGKFVLMRTLIHHTHPLNTKWVIGTSCYLCNRWRNSLLISNSKENLAGTFECL